jgi:hypothetical protein
VIAPVFLTVAVIANWTNLNDAADRYTTPGQTSTVRATLDRDDRRDIAVNCRKELRRPRRAFATVGQCTATRTREEAVAKKLVEDSQGTVVAAALFAGTLSLAFAYVIVSLNAMRAGLLSRFMGVLGIIVGALIVLPLLPSGVPVVEVFWFGALSALFLGYWPGGRGPAWETGEPVPWPTAAERRGLAQDPEPTAPAPEEEEAPVRRRSRKRKGKR